MPQIIKREAISNQPDDGKLNFGIANVLLIMVILLSVAWIGTLFWVWKLAKGKKRSGEGHDME
jgi:hypothetical protein